MKTVEQIKKEIRRREKLLGKPIPDDWPEYKRQMVTIIKGTHQDIIDALRWVITGRWGE